MLRQHFLKTKTTNFKQTEKGRKANAPHFRVYLLFYSLLSGFSQEKGLRVHPNF